HEERITSLPPGRARPARGGRGRPAGRGDPFQLCRAVRTRDGPAARAAGSLHRARPGGEGIVPDQRQLRPGARGDRSVAVTPAQGAWKTRVVSFRVRFTRQARDDLERLYQWMLDRADGDFATAERALQTIRDGITVLELAPMSCR